MKFNISKEPGVATQVAPEQASPTTTPQPVFVPVASAEGAVAAKKKGIVGWLKQRLVSAEDTVALFLKITIGCLVFYALSSYTSFSTNQLNVWTVVFTPSMVQTWTMLFRLLLTIGMALLVLRLLLPQWFYYFSRSHRDGPDASDDFINKITPNQRLWHLYAWVSLICLVAVLLYSVKLLQAQPGIPDGP